MDTKTLTAALLTFAMLLLSQDAFAIGISPGSATFDNMVRGGYSAQTLTISNAGDNDIVVSAQIEGSAGPWLTLTPRLINDTILKGKPLTFKIEVLLPPSVSTGTYNATLIISTLNREDITTGGSGAKFMPGLIVPVTITVSGQELMDYTIKSFTVVDTEKDEPIKYSITVTNKGNVQIKPNITIEVMNADKSRTFFTDQVAPTAVLPSTDKTIEGTLDSQGMKVGRYWIRFTPYLLDRTLPKKEIDFKIVEVGALSLSGELTDLIIPKTAAPGDKVRVTAYFNNTCDKVLEAQSSCEILTGGKLADTIDSKLLQVEPGMTGELASYFTVPSAGEYQFKCIVNYQNKQTDAREATLTAEGSGGGSSSTNYVLIGAIGLVMLVVLYLLYSRTRQR
jgi:hypothetical protein